MSHVIIDPPLARKMFSEIGLWTWVWTIVRVYLGYEWTQAGWHKVTDSSWTSTGETLKGFWERIIVIPEAPARPSIVYDWYRDFIEVLLSGGHHVWFAKVVAYGELLVGVALILGAFVGIAALFGAFMNFNFMLAGSASTNPVLFLGAIFLILAWKTAGHYGLDRWLLPYFGTPWKSD